MHLTPDQRVLALAIEVAAFHDGPRVFNGYHLDQAITHVRTKGGRDLSSEHV